MRLFILAMLGMVAIAVGLLSIAEGRSITIPKTQEQYL